MVKGFEVVELEGCAFKAVVKVSGFCDSGSAGIACLPLSCITFAAASGSSQALRARDSRSRVVQSCLRVCVCVKL